MGHGGAIFNPAIPPLLRAATPTTPTHSYSHTPDLDRSEDRFYSTPAPATVQTLVGHVQHVQAAASSGSAVQLTGTPTAAAQALPLTTITLPHGSGTDIVIHFPFFSPVCFGIFCLFLNLICNVVVVVCGLF